MPMIVLAVLQGQLSQILWLIFEKSGADPGRTGLFFYAVFSAKTSLAAKAPLSAAGKPA